MCDGLGCESENHSLKSVPSVTDWPWLIGDLHIGILLTSVASDGSTARGGTGSFHLMAANELIGNINKTEHQPKNCFRINAN